MTEPVATCLCGLDTNPVASPRMDIHCPKHDGPLPARFHLSSQCDNAAHSACPNPDKCTCECHVSGEPSDEEFNPWYENYEKALVAEISSTATPADEEARALAIRALTEQNSRFALYRSQDPNFRENDVRFWTLQFTTALAEARRAGTPTTDERERAETIVRQYEATCFGGDRIFMREVLISQIESALSSTPSEPNWNIKPSPELLSNWPIRDVLSRLAQAATHLLSDHNCDEHGYEELQHAVVAARAYVNSTPSKQKESDGQHQAVYD